MNLGLVLGMAAAGFGDRVAITAGDASVSYADLSARSWAASASFHERAVPSVVYLGTNHLAYPVALFGAAGAGIPFVPVNYRLGDDQLAAQLDEHPGALVIHEGEPRPFADPDRWVPRQAFYDSLAGRGRARARRAGPRRHLPPPLHQRDDVGPQGGRPAPPAPGVVPVLGVRVRQRRRGGGRPGGRPPLPHRRRGQSALQPLRRPAHRLPRPLRPRALAVHRAGRSR